MKENNSNNKGAIAIEKTGNLWYLEVVGGYPGVTSPGSWFSAHMTMKNKTEIRSSATGFS